MILERARRFERPTLTLARLCSTPELRPRSKGIGFMARGKPLFNPRRARVVNGAFAPPMSERGHPCPHRDRKAAWKAALRHEGCEIARDRCDRTNFNCLRLGRRAGYRSFSRAASRAR